MSTTNKNTMNNNNNNNNNNNSPSGGCETPERFRIKPVQSRRTSLANGVTFLEEDGNNVGDQSVSFFKMPLDELSS